MGKTTTCQRERKGGREGGRERLFKKLVCAPPRERAKKLSRPKIDPTMPASAWVMPKVLVKYDTILPLTMS
jgi:hypothetical protein